MIQVHVLISGEVQGVGYRLWTHKQAEKLGLFGWVKNLVDGRVEAVFCGEEAAVNKMLELCKTGPNLAQVSNVSFSLENPQNFTTFEIRY
jgi:acylphosphatase